MTVPTVAHAGSGNTGGATTSITVTLPDTPASDELTIIELSAPGTAVITPPAGWNRVPRCGGHAGTKSNSNGSNRLWAYYAIGDPGDTTPTFTSDTSLAFAWGCVIIDGANMDQPFGSARNGGSSNTTGGGIANTSIPPTPATDCMVLSLITAPAAAAAYVSGTWVEDVEQSNGSATHLYMVHNTTDYLVADYDGLVTGVTFDWAGTGAGACIQLCIVPETADFAKPQIIGSGLNSQASTTNTLPTGGVGPAGAGSIFLSDWMVPGALAIAFEVSNDEAHTITTIETAIGGHDLTVLGVEFPYDNTLGTLQVSYYVIRFDESTAWNFSDLSTLDYYKFTLSGSVTFIAGAIIALGVEGLPNGIAGYSLQEIASGTGPNPAGFSVSIDDLIITILSVPGNVTVTNPAGYTAQQTLSGGGLNRTSIGYKRATSTGTEDPGAYTLSSAQISTFLAIVLAESGLPPPENLTPPAVTGTPIPPNVLTTDDGTWDYSPTSFTYQWQRSPNGVSSWSDITGETADTYTLTAEDELNYIRCVVTATNGTGSTAANSNAVLIEEYPYIATFSMIG